MSSFDEPEGGLSLLEARKRLVDPSLLHEFLETRRAIQQNRDEWNPIVLRARSEGRSPDEDLARLQENFKALQQAARELSDKVDAQFIPRLVKCRVMARESIPTAPLEEIPQSALPILGPDHIHRLQITTMEGSRMGLYRYGGHWTRYYDVRVWLPQVEPESLAKVQKSKPKRNISEARLYRFLDEHVDTLPPGDAGLTEMALWKSAQDRYSGLHVARSRVRSWIRTAMPSEKRYQRGTKPK